MPPVLGSQVMGFQECCHHEGFLPCFWVLGAKYTLATRAHGTVVLPQWNVIRAQCSGIPYLISQALSQVPVTTGGGDKTQPCQASLAQQSVSLPLTVLRRPLARTHPESGCGWPSCSVVILVSCLPFSVATKVY